MTAKASRREADIKMGAVSASKSRKLQRKQETENLQRVRAIITAAAEARDLMEACPAFRSFDRNGLCAQLAYWHSRELPAALLDWAFSLCKQNMQALYEAVWGWKDRKKREELKHEAARFFIASQAGCTEGSEVPGTPLAFLHCRFEEEDGLPVLYVYDIQLEARCQRKGLGRLLMSLAELAAARSGMQAVMLTVMRANAAALELYRRLGYREHASSPEAAGYVIMHKPLRPRQ